MVKHRLAYMICMKFHTKNKHNIFTCPKNPDRSKNGINFEDPKTSLLYSFNPFHEGGSLGILRVHLICGQRSKSTPSCFSRLVSSRYPSVAYVACNDDVMLRVVFHDVFLSQQLLFQKRILQPKNNKAINRIPTKCRI